ncbi:sugar transferase [Curtobacterium flaccumfaciens]|uniref:sugar transferase n=1 Tax=Curtobacterium flaccumfaciens TaxID=2035 RepID=UPI001266D7D4|nr:sugar transferase [Curtobacterium flaccumfaciens]MBT1665560.1 sugar transferase [Curtobacterium flaccumfaciens pv. flaccumfaciens]MBT1682851.1 sugar transferase [Curtobacterium flaccumfaciens pv. flaccumfaciens]QFS79592.1 sugar transferase [Curtobacterium flaccumfaciens pv. flaccumfaciens]
MQSPCRTRTLRAKRFSDIVGASLALVALAPVLAVVAVLVAARLGRPVLFRQPRPGLHGKTFTILKFRTMLEPDPAAGLVSDSDRLTPFGSFLRSTSLDELPSLWNILRGDMSFVGPRPTLCRYLDLYTAEESRRHDVLPGLTGLAQVRGRNALPWPERLRSDVEYVDTVTLGLDLRILLRTVVVVLRREGIAAPGHVSSDVFEGTAAMTGGSR